MHVYILLLSGMSKLENTSACTYKNTCKNTRVYLFVYTSFQCSLLLMTFLSGRNVLTARSGAMHVMFLHSWGLAGTLPNIKISLASCTVAVGIVIKEFALLHALGLMEQSDYERFTPCTPTMWRWICTHTPTSSHKHPNLNTHTYTHRKMTTRPQSISVYLLRARSHWPPTVCQAAVTTATHTRSHAPTQQHVQAKTTPWCPLASILIVSLTWSPPPPRHARYFPFLSLPLFLVLHSLLLILLPHHLHTQCLQCIAQVCHRYI